MQRRLLGLFAIACFFKASLLCSQDFKISGQVNDSITSEKLEAATVFLERISDSSLVTYTITNPEGQFLLEGRSESVNMRLTVSYNGYAPYVREIKPQGTTDLGIINLTVLAEQLDGVTVTGARVPVEIRKDTVEFNAESFKTRPDATVEDLLRKLPGVEVDKDGNVTVNGKEVNQVLVNGQVFFSKDAQVVTKSLPKDVIEKIQITNTKTKVEEFTGQEGQGDSKTINLTLKEDKNKGILGRLSAGYGTDDRYQSNGLLNYFDDQLRLSVIGSSNNTNSPGFSYDEIYGMLGRTRGGISINSNGGFQVAGLSFGFGQGITTSSNLGASFANSKKGEYRANANYFFALSDSFNDEQTRRENFLPEGSFFTDTRSSFEGISRSHRGSGDLQLDLGKNLRITAEPTLAYSDTESTNASFTESRDATGEVVNSTDNGTLGQSSSFNYSNRVEALQKLDTLGRLLRIAISNQNSRDSDFRLLQSEQIFFEGGVPQSESFDQQTQVENSSDNYTLLGNYREVLGDKFFLDLTYSYRNNVNRNSRLVEARQSDTGNFEVADSLNTDLDFRVRQHIPELSVNKRTDKYSLTVGLKGIFSELSNLDLIRNTQFNKDYRNLEVNARVNWNFSRTKRLWFNYTGGGINLPGITQLQEAPDFSNPLNIRVGNQELNPEVSHRVYLSFNNYDWKNSTGFNFYSGITAINDRIVQNTLTDDQLRRVTTFDNVNGYISAYSGMMYSKNVYKDSLNTLAVRIRPYVSYTRDVGFNNGTLLESRRQNINPRLMLDYSYDNLLEIQPEYRLNINRTRFNLSNIPDIDFTSHTAELRTTLRWPENVTWGNDIQYTYNGNVGPGFDPDFVLWNLSLGIDVWKKKLNVKILAYDLLNQNNNVQRTTGADFVQDFQGTVLRRYFLGSLTWKFDQFGGAKSRDRGGIRFY